MQKQKKDEPELLKLLNSREAWALPEYKVPEYIPQQVERAVREASLLNNSDPFAAARMRLHLQRGYELPSDVIKDSINTIKRRSNEGSTVAEELAPLKKRLDMDVAWDQHKHRRAA